MATSDLLNEQTALIEESNSLLKMLADRTGQYVWKKSTVQGVVNKRLPEGYTELSYIESTGTQRIDFGVSVPCGSEKIIVEFSPTTEDTDNVVCGHAAPSWSWGSNLMFVLDKRLWVANTGISGIDINVGEFYKVEYTSTYCKVNDGASNALNSLTYTDGYNNTLFYASTKYGKMKAKSYQLYNGSTPAIHAIACIEDSTGEVGMYDLVEGTFHGNAGTGEFIAGEVLDIEFAVSDIPDAYPDGGEQDGYWYEPYEALKLPSQITKYLVETVVLSSNSTTIPHSLGEMPMLGFVKKMGTKTYSGNYVNENVVFKPNKKGTTFSGLTYYTSAGVLNTYQSTGTNRNTMNEVAIGNEPGYIFIAGEEYEVTTMA